MPAKSPSPELKEEKLINNPSQNMSETQKKDLVGDGVLDAGELFGRMMEPRTTLTLEDVEPSPMGSQTLGKLIVQNGATVAPWLSAFWNKICDLLEQPTEQRSQQEVGRLVRISRTELASALQMIVALDTIKS